ncbi:hypothetical protein MS6204_05143 [Escherichia coli]|nr:hypothetical protein [Escherichia coli]
MARTMTVALGDELWEYIESLIESGDYRTQSEGNPRVTSSPSRETGRVTSPGVLRDLLAEGLSSGEPVSWEKNAFLKKVKGWREGFR